MEKSGFKKIDPKQLRLYYRITDVCPEDKRFIKKTSTRMTRRKLNVKGANGDE